MRTDFELWKQGKPLISRPSKVQRFQVKGGIDFGRYTVCSEALPLPGIEIKWATTINEDIAVGEIVVIDKGNTFSRVDKDIVQHTVSFAGG